MNVCDCICVFVFMFEKKLVHVQFLSKRYRREKEGEGGQWCMHCFDSVST